MNIRHLEQKDNSISAMTINAFSVKAFLYEDNHQAGATQYGSSKLDFSKTNFKAVLNRNGQDHILFQDNLKILGLFSMMNTRGQLAFYQDHDHYVNLGPGKSMVAFNVILGGCIKIGADDRLTIEVQNNDGVFAVGYQQNSYLEIKPLKAVGYERFIPEIKSWAIQGGESSNNYSIGSNVIRTAVLNFDKTDFTNPVLSNVAFNSDRLNDSFTFYDLVNMKNLSLAKDPFNIATEDSTIYEEDQSFLLTDLHQQFNDLTLDIQFNSAQVNAAQNYIVACRYKTDWTILDNAAKLEAQHAQTNASKIPASVSK